ncbi:MAG TPA: hypothetical protein VGX76_08640 [Pirellulales bacterium]|nr:hypothetical protein [Pirellulales bacterium]
MPWPPGPKWARGVLNDGVRLIVGELGVKRWAALAPPTCPALPACGMPPLARGAPPLGCPLARGAPPPPPARAPPPGRAPPALPAAPAEPQYAKVAKTVSEVMTSFLMAVVLLLV